MINLDINLNSGIFLMNSTEINLCNKTDINKNSIISKMKFYAENSRYSFDGTYADNIFKFNIFYDGNGELKLFNGIWIEGRTYSKGWEGFDEKLMINDFNKLKVSFVDFLDKEPEEIDQFFVKFLYYWGSIQLNCIRRDNLVGVTFFIN